MTGGTVPQTPEQGRTVDAIYSPARVVSGFILGALERISVQTDQNGHAN